MAKDRSLSTAIQILTLLSKRKGTRVTSDFLATSLRTNPGLVRRVLSKLATAKLVETTVGKHGGSRLLKRESQISISDIYDVVQEGPLFGTFDKEPFKPCPVSCQIGDVLSDVYEDLENDLRKKMSKVKLSVVVDRIV